MNDCPLLQPKVAILPDNYSLELYDNALSLHGTPWSDLITNDLFYNIEYLARVEKICKEWLDPHYGIVYRYDLPVAAFYFQTVRFRGRQLLSFLPVGPHHALYRWFVIRPLRYFLHRLDTPLLVAGNLLQTNHDGIFFDASLSDACTKAAIVENMCIKMLEHTGAKVLLITNIYDQSDSYTKCLNKSYHIFHSEPDLQLEVQKQWLTFDDYLLSLQSKYRVRARKILKESSDFEVRRLTQSEIESYEDDLFKLNRLVMRRVKFSLGDIPQNYFTEIAEHFGDKFILNGYFKQGELVGFSSLIIEDDLMHSHFIGMNYDYVNTGRLYNRILYDNLEVAIKHRSRILKYGRTATEIKTTIGAKPVDMINFLMHRNRVLNYFIKQALILLKPPVYQARMPFK